LCGAIHSSQEFGKACATLRLHCAINGAKEDNMGTQENGNGAGHARGAVLLIPRGWS
jgi:hypothetical protein